MNNISLFHMDMYDACNKRAVQIYDGQGNRVAMDCENTTLASVKHKIKIVFNKNCSTSPFWLDFRGKFIGLESKFSLCFAHVYHDVWCKLTVYTSMLYFHMLNRASEKGWKYVFHKYTK